MMQGQQSVADVADAFRSHVPLIADLAIASISGDVGQSARQVEALKDISACFEQLPKVQRLDLSFSGSCSCVAWSVSVLQAASTIGLVSVPWDIP